MRAVRFMVAVATLAVPAAAHPVHEVVQNAYLTLAPGRVELALELTAGPQVAGKVLAALDTDRDRRVSDAEAHSYAARVLRQSRLTVDGRPLSLRLLSVDVPTYPALLGAHGTIRITAGAIRAEHGGAATLVYRNGYSPAESRCDANIFLKPGPGLRYQVVSQDRSNDGRTLTVHFTSTR